MRTSIKSTYQFIKLHWRGLFLVELIYKFIFLFLYIPIVSLGINLALRLSKYSYITTENIVHFVTYLPTIMITLLLVVLLAILIQMETGSIFYYFNHAQKDDKRETGQVIFAGIKHVYFVFQERNYLLPIYSLLMAFFMNIPLIIIIITQSRIPSYFVHAMTSERYARILIAIIASGLILFLYRGIFAIPICIIEKKSFVAGWRKSNQRLKENNCSTISKLLVTNLLLSLVYAILYIVCILILVLGIYWFAKKEISIALFLKSYDLLSKYLCIFISIMGFAINHTTIFGMYVKIREDRVEDMRENDSSVLERESEGKERGHRDFRSIVAINRGLAHKTLRQIKYQKARTIAKKQLKNFAILLVCLAAFSVYSYFINSVRNGMFRVEESLLGIQITSHRGNSVEAPENTIPALQSAMDRLADFAEIDVQLTSDGTVVLMHDKSLYRTAGVKKTYPI